MSARAFDFRVDGKLGFAQGHAHPGNPRVTLCAGTSGPIGIDIRMTAAEARAMAVALEAAATHAENTLVTGLGESAAA